MNNFVKKLVHRNHEFSLRAKSDKRKLDIMTLTLFLKKEDKVEGEDKINKINKIINWAKKVFLIKITD